jgi:hypothetical protein
MVGTAEAGIMTGETGAEQQQQSCSNRTTCSCRPGQAGDQGRQQHKQLQQLLLQALGSSMAQCLLAAACWALLTCYVLAGSSCRGCMNGCCQQCVCMRKLESLLAVHGLVIEPLHCSSLYRRRATVQSVYQLCCNAAALFLQLCLEVQPCSWPRIPITFFTGCWPAAVLRPAWHDACQTTSMPARDVACMVAAV